MVSYVSCLSKMVGTDGKYGRRAAAKDRGRVQQLEQENITHFIG